MKIHAYLFFDGQCAEAMTYYAECLGGELQVMPFSDNPECAGEVPTEQGDRTLHACLMVGDQLLMASDCMPENGYQGVKGCSISLQVNSIKEAERLYTALVVGGQAQMPLQQTFWAVCFGTLVDRFGVSWMINCEADQPA